MANGCDPCVCPDMSYQDNNTFKLSVLKLLCKIYGYIGNLVSTLTGATVAYFDAATKILFSSIGAGYSAAVTLVNGTKVVIFDNQTDGDVWVSMDGGTSDMFHVRANERLVVNLNSIGLSSIADIRVKRGVDTPTAGYFYIYTWRSAVLGALMATFAAATDVTVIGAAYALAVTLPTATKTVAFDNQTDGDVWVSMDAGVTDHFHITAGELLYLTLAEIGLFTSAVIHTKDGTVASTAGHFYIYSWK